MKIGIKKIFWKKKLIKLCEFFLQNPPFRGGLRAPHPSLGRKLRPQGPECFRLNFSIYLMVIGYVCMSLLGISPKYFDKSQFRNVFLVFEI